MLACNSSVQTNSTGSNTAKQIAEYLHSGDIIFRMGYGAVSYLIDKRLDPYEHISHVGMVLQDSGHWVVVHSIPGDNHRKDGTQQISFMEFVADAKPNSIQILRPDEDYFNRDSIEKYLRYELKASKPFDLELNPQDSSQIYCIELIWNALKKGNSALKLDGIEEKSFCELLSHSRLYLILQ